MLIQSELTLMVVLKLDIFFSYLGLINSKERYKKLTGYHKCLSSPICSDRFFDRYILTGRALKLILYDFSSNFILNM